MCPENTVQHTPGPWRLWLSPDDPGQFMLWGDSPEPHGSDMLIVQRNCGTPNGAEGVANARLMAAAPDLVQALREVEGDCYYMENPGDNPRCCFCHQDYGEPHEPECTMRFVLTALAKTEGN